MARVCIELDCDGNGNGNGQVVRTFSQIVGDGQQSDFLIQHNLGTQDIFVTVRDLNSGQLLTDVDVVANSINSATVAFDAPPAPNSVRVHILAAVPLV